jgi:hypothetical protein
MDKSFREMKEMETTVTVSRVTRERSTLSIPSRMSWRVNAAIETDKPSAAGAVIESETLRMIDMI